MHQQVTLLQNYTRDPMKTYGSSNLEKPIPLPPGVSARTLIIHFDIDYTEQVGTIGFILCGLKGTGLGGKGLCNMKAQARITHNMAEVLAAWDCLAYVGD